jgi:hypothetical protein
LIKDNCCECDYVICLYDNIALCYLTITAMYYLLYWFLTVTWIHHFLFWTNLPHILSLPWERKMIYLVIHNISSFCYPQLCSKRDISSFCLNLQSFDFFPKTTSQIKLQFEFALINRTIRLIEIIHDMTTEGRPHAKL